MDPARHRGCCQGLTACFVVTSITRCTHLPWSSAKGSQHCICAIDSGFLLLVHLLVNCATTRIYQVINVVTSLHTTTKPPKLEGAPDDEGGGEREWVEVEGGRADRRGGLGVTQDKTEGREKFVPTKKNLSRDSKVVHPVLRLCTMLLSTLCLLVFASCSPLQLVLSPVTSAR